MNKDINTENDGLQLEGRNPVLEAINHNKPINKIFIKKEPEGSVKLIASKARAAGIVVVEAEKSKLDEISRTGNHQGVIALCPPFGYAELEDILENAAAKNEKPFIIALDGINDPHNLGAIIRTAEASGAHGVIIPKRRAASVTETVARTSAGALEHVMVSRVTNMANTIEWLKKKGLWAVCTDTASKPMYAADLSGAVVIVIGGEGEGVSRLVKEKCDFSVSIPMYGKVSSLNASAAAALLLYEVVRARNF